LLGGYAVKIESIDFFYLSMPEILDIGDGSQDTVLVRLEAGGHVGWGECESSPLVTIAGLVCPKSHSKCRPVRDSVLGQRLESAEDILRIGDRVHENSLDMLQADHVLSGIDVAMWDALARARGVPVYELLGYERAYPKTPYASVLFGTTAQETLQKARNIRRQGYRAAKFGWEPFGEGEVQDDVDQVVAAREGLGKDGILLIDAGTVWGDDVERARQSLPVLQQCRATWLEEPFVSSALDAYRRLAGEVGTVKLAGGEGAHNFYMAQHMIDYAGIGYVQIDAGRIGGITVAKRVADYAHARGVTYVNHTFTSNLALSASMQAGAGLKEHVLCEYPTELKPLAYELTREHIVPDAEGLIRLPDAPGLGVTPDMEAVKRYLVDVEIRAKGEVLYRTPFPGAFMLS
jgi:L-alanine-DL-glutamate epimerase-like enolase superfamily enzyme